MIDRMIVNAAIEKMITGEDPKGESARVVIAAFSGLPPLGVIACEVTKNSTTHDTFTGHTGKGDITVEDKEKKESKEWSFGITKERVGYYRVWKRKEGCLCIQYFWKSDASTQAIDSEKDPPCYYLGYDGQDPMYFGVEVKVPLFQFSLLGTINKFFRAEIGVLYGELKNRKVYYGLEQVVG